MDEKGINGASTGEVQATDAAAPRGFGRGRFLVAAGGAAVGLTALGGLSGTDTAEAAIAGPYYMPDAFFGEKESETDRSAAIKKADEKAAEAGGYVLFGPRTYKFKSTLRFSAPWVGVPRRTVLEAQAGFTYLPVAELEQFVAVNAHFSRTFGSTADNVLMEGVDWLINTDSGSEKKGSIGLGNVAGGVIRDCQFSTVGTSTMGALLDLYSCVQGVEIDRVRITNLTKGTAGVGLNVRNLVSGAGAATERIVIRDSYVGTSTADEAIAIYGVLGLTTNVRVIDTTVIALPSSQGHIHIASTFPFSEEGKLTGAGVEDVEWRGCRFIDTSGNIKKAGNLLAFGQEGDEPRVCQNIRAVDCSFVLGLSASTSSVVGVRNIAQNAANAGNYLKNPRISIIGTIEIETGILGFPLVESPVVIGAVKYGVRKCGRVLGGSVEAKEIAFYGCGEVSGVTAKLTMPTAIACYFDGTSAVTASMRGCLIEGGQRLVQTFNKAGEVSTLEESRIDVTNNRMIPGATSGEVVTNGVKAHLRVVGNTISTSAALTFPEPGYNSVKHTQSILNDWNGTPEGV
jgi:hypothetical protein